MDYKKLKKYLSELQTAINDAITVDKTNKIDSIDKTLLDSVIKDFKDKMLSDILSHCPKTGLQFPLIRSSFRYFFVKVSGVFMILFFLMSLLFTVSIDSLSAGEASPNTGPDLELLKENPCYETFYMNSIRSQAGSSNVGWRQSCTPLKIRLQWSIEDKMLHNDDPERDESIKYRFVETYPGALVIMTPGKKIPGVEFPTSFEIRGGRNVSRYGEQLLKKIKPQLLEVNASFLNWKDKMLFAGQESRRVQIRKTDLLVADTSEIDFHYTSLHHLLHIVPTYFEINREECATLPWKCGAETPFGYEIMPPYFHAPGKADRYVVETGKSFPAQLFSYEDAKRLKKGEAVERVFPLQSKEDMPGNRVAIRTGLLDVKLIRANQEDPGVLVVTPNNIFRAERTSTKKQYTPRIKKYRLKNTGKEPLEFQITTGADWLAIDKPKGMLDEGKGLTVSIKLIGKADKLSAPRTATVSFKNLTDGKGNTTRKATLREVQKWQLEYRGYKVLNFLADTISGRIMKGGWVDQLVGGLKIYWKILINFEVEETKEGKKYINGTGSARVTKLENFSRPAGVYECSSMEKPIPLRLKNFSVDGSITSKGEVKVIIPKNKYYFTMDCLLDKDALKKHLSELGYTKFPTLAGKRNFLKSRFNESLISGSRVMVLKEHKKIIDNYTLYGLERRLILLEEK